MYAEKLIYYFVGTTGTRKSLGFCFKGKAHTKDIAHGISQRLITSEMRIRINVGMNFHVNIVLSKQVAQLIGYFNTFRNF